MYQTTIGIDGMRCGMCESHMNDVIRRSFAVEKVTSSHEKKQTVILSKEALDQEALKAAIAQTGYTFLDISVEEVEKKGMFSFLKK